MKKLAITVCAFALALVMTSCGGNTPQKAAEKAVECIQDENYEGYVDMVYMKPDETKNAEDVKNSKQMLTALLKDKASKQKEKNGGIEKYETLSEEMAEDGNTAVVKMKITYGDGSEKEEDVKMRKDENGDWKVDMGK